VSRQLGYLAARASYAAQSAIGAVSIPAWRSKFVVIVFGLLFSALLGRAFYLATNPLNRLRSAMVVANAPQDSLVALVREAERLKQLSSNIESLSISQLKAELQNSISVAQRAALEFNAQSQAWSDLRGKIKEDSTTYNALRADLAKLQELQQGEILRLKKMLDEAQRPSIFADAWNLGLSFALGVLSSILASWLYEAWKGRQLNGADA
jgi:hypothetical protein